jgi:hypothetical protein
MLIDQRWATTGAGFKQLKLKRLCIQILDHSAAVHSASAAAKQNQPLLSLRAV